MHTKLAKKMRKLAKKLLRDDTNCDTDLKCQPQGRQCHCLNQYHCLNGFAAILLAAHHPGDDQELRRIVGKLLKNYSAILLEED